MEDAGRTTAAPALRRWLVPAGVAAVIAVHYVLTNAAVWDKAGTFDESSHIANGYSNWVTGDYRMYPVAILQHRWMTLPLVLSDYNNPEPTGPMWTNVDNWEYGRQFMYRLGNDTQRIHRQTRAMTAIWSALLCWLIFVWARQLFGTAGGFVALVLYAFNPNVLAHAALATIDLPAALAFTAALYTLWQLLDELTTKRLIISCVVWGLALTSKFSTLLLVPMAVLLLCIRLLNGKPWPIRLFGWNTDVDTKPRMLPWFALLTVAHALAVWLTIWAMFGFRFTMSPVDPAMFTFSQNEPPRPQAEAWLYHPVMMESRLRPVIKFFYDFRMFPEAYLMCFCNTLATVAGSATYLDGWFGGNGFVSFFPLAFLYKTPLPVFILMGLAWACHIARRMRQMREGQSPGQLFVQGFYATAPLWVLLLGYSYSAITGSINIGIRHILPAFPAIFILMGAAGGWFEKSSTAPPADRPKPTTKSPPNGVPKRRSAGSPVSVAKWAVVGCLVWNVIDVVRPSIYPNYLAYFNAIGGGPANGYQHLVDSSYDWGQELPALNDWLARNVYSHSPQPRVYLSYFGSVPPSAVGLKVTMLPSFWSPYQLEPNYTEQFEMQLQPGLYCISASMLQSVYNNGARGPWTAEHEERYKALLQNVSSFASADAAKRQELVEKAAAQTGVDGNRVWSEMIEQLKYLRLGRLCRWLRTRTPIKQINYGILIYNLSAADLEQALLGGIDEKTLPKNPTQPDEKIQYR